MRYKDLEKQKLIKIKAISLFAQNGYNNTSINQITDTVGIAAGSFYIYYKSKEDLLTEIFIDLWSEIANKIEDIQKSNKFPPDLKLEGLIDTIFDAFIINPDLAKIFVNEHSTIMKLGNNKLMKFYKRFLEIGENIVREGIDKKIFNNKISITVYSSYIFGSIRYLLHLWAEDNNNYHLNLIRENVKFVSMNGIKNK